jgi:hypothetical protein
VYLKAKNKLSKCSTNQSIGDEMVRHGIALDQKQGCQMVYTYSYQKFKILDILFNKENFGKYYDNLV